MRSELQFFPEGASSLAGQVDALYLVWAAVSVFFSLLIAALLVFFFIKYKRRTEDEIGLEEREAPLLEIAWSVIPLIICLLMFVWGTRVFFDIYRPPSDAQEYFAVGKQWMWKFQHPEGVREINNLHVPVGQAIKVTMTSEDVIHSLYVPAFRTKQDAVPGRYTTLWFKATKPGTYHLFCAEYCGTEHSRMIGQLIALSPRDYEQWLSGSPAGKTPVASGAQLFQTFACDTCHRDAKDPRPPRAPQLAGLYGRDVTFADGGTAKADDTYLRESILNPAAKLVAGWQPIMPTFQGQVSEEQLAALLAYIKSLQGSAEQAAAGGNAAAADRGTL
ncbi:MAG TPA: cytochrome c oxidase subunit II [Thermoanaerobaculia bacterium]|jgi:cytochrome c oxidase subunit 2|nr:cytochrome c oxidase subunit II [Thermoanaerobaculia bacterium]